MQRLHFCNISTIIGFNKIIDEKVFIYFIKTLIKNFPNLKCCYTQNGISFIQVSDEDFYKNKIRILQNHDDNKLLYVQQNTKLDIETGNTFFATLNHHSNTSSIIFSINHVVADGQTVQIIAYLAILIISLKKIRLKLFLSLLKFHNSKIIKKNIEYMPTFYFSDNKLNHKYNQQDKQSVLSIDLDVKLKHKIHNVGNDISAAAIMAMKILYPNEKNIELRRPIGLRNRIKGLKSLLLGEYHVSASTIYNIEHDLDFNKLKLYLKQSTTINDKIKQSYEVLSKLNNNMTDLYDKLLSHASQYCTISVSSFVHAPKIFKNVYLKASPVFLTGNKAFFSIVCVVVENTLKLCISYNPHKINHNQAALFIINTLSILNIEADQQNIYKLFELSYYE